MEVWIDSIQLDTIRTAKALGLLHGVTTNPSILPKSKELLTIQLLLDNQEGPITVQVRDKDSCSMLEQALALEEISERIIVKIPVTQEGLKAIHVLSKKGIQIMATIVFSASQYLFAAKAGATYVAPYYSGINKSGLNADQELMHMLDMKERYKFPTKLLAASLQNLEDIQRCIDIGVDAITLKDSLFFEWIKDHPLTQERERNFLITSID